MRKVLIIFFVFMLIFNSSAFAQSIAIPMPTISVTPSLNPTPVNYELPYPGILPGSSLFKVKQIRDLLIEFIPSAPIKKSEFYLLQADKGLAAFLILYEKGEKDLAFKTLSKSQLNLDKSFEKMKEANKIGGNLGEMNAKIKTSAEKQKEEINNLRKKNKSRDLEKVNEYYHNALIIQNKASSFKP